VPDPRADLGLDALRAHEAGREGISRYERLEKLGAGGMAVVYRALDRKLGREVALKELREELELDPDGLARFRREAEALARLSHPNVVGFYDLVEDGGRELLVMELVRGMPLDKLLATRPERRVLLLLLEKVARSVDHAHEQGIVHRDLKPSNVLVTESGEPKVSDFGLAQLAGLRTALTTTGAILGTPSYMAPEQAQGAGPLIDRRTDVYALGVMLYEILSGKPPFTADSLPALLNRVLNEDPPSLGPSVHPDLETIARRCLEKEPERRYPTARDLADDVRRFLDGEPIRARRPGRLERGWVWVRRNRKLALALAALALAVSAGGVGSAFRLEESRARRRIVEGELARAGADDPGPFDPGAIDRIVRADAPGSTALLVDALASVTADLESVVRDVYLSAAEPDEAERRAGLKPIPGIALALDRCFSGPALSDLDPVSGETLLAAITRIEDRAARGRPRDAQAPEPDVRVMIAALQEKRLHPGRRRLARLACEALGRLGRREGAVEALSRYLGAVEDEVAAAYAGEALARLGGPEAERVLTTAYERFDHSGIFWQRVQPVLGSAAKPSRTGGYRRQGYELAQRGDLDGAIAALTSAIRHDARDPYAWYDRGAARLEKHDVDGALLDLTRAVELLPLDPTFFATRGAARAERGDIRGAIADLTSSIAMDPARAAPYINRGNARRRGGDLEGAIADLTSAIALDPTNAAAYSNRGLAKKAARDRDGALADFSAALERDPRSAPALTNRGLLFHERGDEASAIADLSRAIEIAPRALETRFNRGLAYMKTGNSEAAIVDFTCAIEVRPGLSLAWWQRGVARKNLGDYAASIADLTKALELDPEPARILNDRGVVRRLANDLAGSLEDLDQAVLLAPEVSEARINRGATLSALGEPVKAIADFTRAIDLDPERSNAWVNRGVVRGARGDREGALADLTKGIELAPRDPSAWADRARVKAKMGDRAGADADYTREIEVNPRDAGSFRGRGLLRKEAGDRAGAIADLARALEIEPAGAEAEGARQVLEELRGK
jgi:tetratricopeptide (TPR) repeat protein/predicted Ser/Thr protein kinase